MTALKDCPHDKSEHTRNINGYWVCRACQRERMRLRRPATGIGAGGINKAKTHCPHKHKYTPGNTILYKGRRHCRECARANARRQNLKQYGITLEQYEAMLIAQGGRCAICGDPFMGKRGPHIDHDHSCCPGRKSCGKCIRDLLCQNCNILLGAARDLPEILRFALGYLEKYQRLC